MPRKTRAGAEAAAKWRAFRRYLDDIEKYEGVEEAKAIFERYLPYATAFGLDRTWVAKFASVQAPTPSGTSGPRRRRCLPAAELGPLLRGAGAAARSSSGGGWGGWSSPGFGGGGAAASTSTCRTCKT